MTKVAIIVGSTRPNRFADHPTRWILEEARKRPELQPTVVDLREYPLPFYQDPVVNNGVHANPDVGRWVAAIAAADAYIIITAEYNHSFTGVLKNALDHAYAEWNRKPVAFVGYGGVGAARAVEQLRMIAIELQMAPIKHAVHIPTQAYLAVAKEGKSLSSFDYLQTSAVGMLEQLSWWAQALNSARTDNR